MRKAAFPAHCGGDVADQRRRGRGGGRHNTDAVAHRQQEQQRNPLILCQRQPALAAHSRQACQQFVQRRLLPAHGAHAQRLTRQRDVQLQVAQQLRDGRGERIVLQRVNVLEQGIALHGQAVQFGLERRRLRFARVAVALQLARFLLQAVRHAGNNFLLEAVHVAARLVQLAQGSQALRLHILQAVAQHALERGDVAVLAKFSYLYQNYDVQYATQCLQHASAIYTKLAAASGRDAEKFMALTELYRAAGLPSYRSQILEYKEFFEDNTCYLEETAYLYGSMTYLATRQSVDIDLCTAFMEGIRDQGEELAKRSGKMIDAVTSVNNGTEDLLKRAEELACANYILYSYQYTEILEDFLHYLMGRNRDSVCYYPEEGKTSDYLLLIAQQVSLTGKH